MLAWGPTAAAAAEAEGRLTLKGAIDIALKEHPSLKESQEKVAAARYQIGVSRAAFFPQVSLLSNYYYGDAFPSTGRGGTSFGSPTNVSSPTIDNKATDYYIYRFSVNQLLYDFGKTPGLLDESKSTYQQTREDYSGNRQKVVLDARTAYFGYLAAQRAVKVEEDNVAQNQALLKQAQGFYQVGLRAKIDVTKAEANLYDAEASLIRAKNLVDLTRVNLMTALGLKTFPYKHLEDILEVTPQPQSLGELKTQAVRQRPELLKNRYQQDFNDAALKVAKAGYFPALTSSAAYGWQGALYPLPSNWWVGVGLTFPLFEGLATTYNVRVANANTRATLANSEVLQQDINKEVEQSFLDLQSGWELVRSTKKAMEAARENFRLAQGRYQVGVGSIIEVTDAQVQLSRADLRYVQALYDYRVSEAKLDKAVGKAF
jgi:TolC family type I secretion outer membrane protein